MCLTTQRTSKDQGKWKQKQITDKPSQREVGDPDLITLVLEELTFPSSANTAETVRPHFKKKGLKCVSHASCVPAITSELHSFLRN